MDDRYTTRKLGFEDREKRVVLRLERTPNRVKASAIKNLMMFYARGLFYFIDFCMFVVTWKHLTTNETSVKT